MEIGVVIQAQEGVSWSQWEQLAAACDTANIRTLYTSDHDQSGRDPACGGLDAWTALAGIAAVTQDLRLGTLVSPVGFRPPALLAKIITTVDHISGGRVDVGLGIGWHEPEHLRNGLPFPPPPDRLEMLGEQLEALTGLWSGEPCSLAGRHFRLQEAQATPRPVQQPRPYLIIGGSARTGTLRLAARWADEYNTSYVTPTEAARRRARWDEECARLGHGPRRFSVMTGAVTGESDAEVEPRLERLRRIWAPTADSDTFRRAFAARAIIGDVQSVHQAVEAYRAAGVDRMMLGLDATDLRSVELIGELARRLSSRRGRRTMNARPRY